MANITLSKNWQNVASVALGYSAGTVQAVAQAKYTEQDVAGNYSKVKVRIVEYYDGPTIDCGVWRFTAYGDFYGDAYKVNSSGDICDTAHYGYYTFGNGTNYLTDGNGKTGGSTWIPKYQYESPEVTVYHNSNGTKRIKIGCWGSFTSWGWEGSSGYEQNNIYLPTIDRSGTTIQQNCTAISNTQISLNATTADTCDSWEYSLDGNAWVNFSHAEGTSATGTITVTEGVHTVQIQARKKSNHIWTKATTQTVYTTLPQVSFSVTDIGTDSIAINATSNIASINWGYSINGGSSYTDLTYQIGTGHHEYTFTGLDINTEYPIRVRVKNPANDLYGYSNIIIVKTQGGIVHVPVNNVWKDALAYVVVENTWKQAIAYTVSDNDWRIGT